MQYDIFPSPGAPIYLQIAREMRLMIVSGTWPPGSRMLPVQQLSLQYGINPNTVQRALSELVQEGLICQTPERYFAVTEDIGFICSVRCQLAFEHAERYLRQMHALGFTASEMHDCLDHTATHLEGGTGSPQPRG